MPSEMTLDWLPDETLLKTYAYHQGLSLDSFTDSVISAFTGHYEPRGQVNTQAEWVSMLVKWVKNDKARTAANNVTSILQKAAKAAEFDDDDIGWQNGVQS
ncbi:DnaT-like ssDNA-binding domain-containing protein [Pseudomonas protegens]|uniref:DnaT-like ssDNA-binding domain-containing protein n=1 Tax=Pseudomonas protegens TaxID=380021 RepID=UPI0021AE83E3|nr:DnaT-like ssDNA-binding domain-containing protein [Pseudomonas protegens]